MWGDTVSSDVGVVWMFISVLFFFLGLYVGVRIEKDERPQETKRPEPEEVRIVLENLLFGCSHYERECIEEAIEIVRREEDESQMDSERD